MWREGLLIKLENMGIGGRMYNWIASFFAERKIRVKVGDEYSRDFKVENGTPQGSVISPLLFNIMINDIFLNLDECIKSALYADDGAIWMRGRNVPHLAKNIKRAVNKIEKWSYEWGFKLSVSKSCYMIFTNKRNIDIGEIKLYDQPIKRVDEFKYLGLWLDSSYTWKTHIKQLETKCKKVINLMKAVAGNDWGADKQSLLNIYRALMRSAIDYGCIVYEAAAKTSLQIVDKLQYRALRLATGATKTTPINALLVEAGDTPLEIRRVRISLSYWIRVKSSSEGNPAKSIIKNCWEYSKFTRKGFGWNVNEWAKMYELEDKTFSQNNPISAVPPWLFPETKVDLKIHEMKREWKHNEVGVKSSIYIRQSFYSFLKIYTDGSKNSKGNVGIGIFIPEFNICICERLTDLLSIYTAEMVAIIFSLQWVEEVRPDRVVICTDSKAAIESIHSGGNSRKDLVIEIYQSLYRLYRYGIEVQFCWVPAHEGVKGNETADKLAKKALGKQNKDQISFGKGEGKSIIKKKETEIWQKIWDEDEKGRRLYRVQKSVIWKNYGKRSRREEIIFTRLRTGHTYLNEFLYIIGKRNNDICEGCAEKENVDHVLMNCIKYAMERERMRKVIMETGRDWSIKGILGTDGDREENMEINKALFLFLHNKK
ncbi:uncharacterized protein LOC118559100 [Fundulus heteroclitus]|uniref:uncharacterized protein LOC118559100 n=1 Tax=Fundulus heteroclitus TaxID=8078 RepID=UPI00165A423C|nr:uncharacterized protein LOC118559100 [Fundulus heteroclitus]